MSNVLSVHDLYSLPEEYLAGERVSQTKARVPGWHDLRHGRRELRA